MKLCKICFKPKGKPYRRWNLKREITEGCVSKFHNDASLMPTDYAWHWSKEAKATRRITNL